MRLLSIRLKNVGPFADTTIRLADLVETAAGEETAAPVVARPVTILFGGDGTGKTTLLSALALTRPGYALPPIPQGREAREGEPTWVATEWALGEDDPERPHPLVVTSPSAILEGETADTASIRRREQNLFDRRAQNDGGFVFVAFSGARWFSRAANMLSVPERSIVRYDVRAPVSFDDPTRADLTRDTKQVLAYAAIARALGAGREEYEHLAVFATAVSDVAQIILEPFGFAYAGVSPTSLEPEARDAGGRMVAFDALPRPVRHVLAFAVLTLRALFSAYPDLEDPREREGVVAIDDIESQQDPALLRSIVPLLRRALPNVQWILTTASTHLAMACAPNEVVALRKRNAADGGGGEGVDVGEGVLH
jgi:hypothetical protein